jgi:transcriptional regulator with XRE-family HTH domain
MNNEFNSRLKKAIEDRGITASELSRISGVGKSDISYYMKGKYLPKQDKVYMLARALDVDPGWLMTGVEQITVPDTSRVPIIVPDSKGFIQIVHYMTTQDYEMVMSIFEKTYKKMKEIGVEIE